MESAFLKDASSPGDPLDVDVVDDLVSSTTDRDEVNPVSKVVVGSSHDLDVDDSKGKAVSTQKPKHEDFQIM